MSHSLPVSLVIVLSGFLQGQVPQYSRGDVVRLVAPGSGESLPDSLVIAVPGDHIQASDARILVNGEPVRNVSAELVAQFSAEPWDQPVPDGHYVVVGERHESSGTVRYHGLIPAAKILRKVSG